MRFLNNQRTTSICVAVILPAGLFSASLLGPAGCTAAVRECPKEGCPDGMGFLRLVDGFYRGEWSGGRFHGTGERVWTARDGRPAHRYVGGWRAGEMHGKGTAYAGKKVEYSGYYCRGSRLGHCADGDCVNGTGTLTNFRGVPLDTYSGQFQGGLPHGEGQVEGHRWKHSGSWKECVPHGKGRQTREIDRIVLDGHWTQGEMTGRFLITETGSGRLLWDGYYCMVGPKSLYLMGRCPNGEKILGCRHSVCKQGDCVNGPGVLEGSIDNERAVFTGTFQDGLLHGEFSIAVGSEKPFAGRFDRCAVVPVQR